VKRKASVKSSVLKEDIYVASQFQLIWWKFRKHKLAILGGTILAFFFLSVLFCEFFSMYNLDSRYSDYIYCPPQKIHFFNKEGFHLRPFVYRFEFKLDPEI